VAQGTKPRSVGAFVKSVLTRSMWMPSLLILAPHAAAADEAAGGDGVRNQLELIEEIIVTAQKREESQQRVPISVQVVDGKTLSDNNINSLSTLSEVTPSLHVEPIGRSNDMYLRGIGSGNNSSFDQSVATFEDDIYHGRSRTSAATFLDLSRIEILKGPQGTYFGDNAIAGALSLVTNRPGDEFEAFSRALYGQYGQYAYEGAVSGPLTKTFAMRLAATVNGLDGWLKNTNDGTHSPGQSNKAARLTMLWRPGENLDVSWKNEFGKEGQRGGLVQQLVGCPPPTPFKATNFCSQAITLGLPTGLNNNLNSFSPGQGTVLNTAETVLGVNYHLGDLTLTSLSGYYYYDYDLQVDGDALPANLLTAAVPEHFHQFSQELRLSSPSGGVFEYMGGVYFHDSRLEAGQDLDYFFLTPMLTSARFAALGPYLPLGQNITYTLPEKTYSVFGSVTWRATDQWSFSAGLRGSEVKKNIDWTLYYGTASRNYDSVVQLPANLQALASGSGLGTPGVLAESRTDRALMPSAKTQYQFSSGGMAYLSFSRGFKAGGFNGTDISGVAANLPYKPEYVNAYEAGVKTTWLQSRLLFNADVFLMDYTGLQVTANNYGPTGAVISLVKNAATARSQGVEIEARWHVTSHFQLSAEATYLEAFYRSYPNAGPSTLEQAQGIKIQDLTGRPTSLAPRWSENVTASYGVPLGGGYLFTSEAVGFCSAQYFLSSGTDDPLLSQGDYCRLDGRLVLEAPNSRWNVAVLGRNLTNRNILDMGSALPTSAGSFIVNKEQPRNVAVQFEVRF
jgi:iron complex outermembrane recepter protein